MFMAPTRRCSTQRLFFNSSADEERRLWPPNLQNKSQATMSANARPHRRHGHLPCFCAGALMGLATLL
jgi:hypothetical protein